MTNYIDLHIHSKYSGDGEFSISQLMEKCQEAGITIMSITDHDSAKANITAKAMAKDYHIHYITGIEIDCTYKGINLHLLGYGFDETSPDFEALEEHIWTEERNASLERIDLTRQLGFKITKEELNKVSNLKEGGIWTGEVFAEVLLEKTEYKNHELLLPYRKGGVRGDNPMVNFYWDYYSQGKPCYVHLDFPSLEDAIGMIHRNGGKAVLAHPGNNLKGNFELIKEIKDLGLDGIEVFCSYHHEEMARQLYDLAVELDLIITCGSDYHGKTKPAVKLGGYPCWIPLKELENEFILKGLLK